MPYRHVKHHPFRHCPHVQLACVLRTPQQYTVVELCAVALAFTVHDLHTHTERCQNVCASALLRRTSPVHGSLYMYMYRGVVCSVVRRWNALFLHVFSTTVM